MIGSADHDFLHSSAKRAALFGLRRGMRLSIKYVQGQTGALMSIDENKSSMQANFVARLPAEAGRACGTFGYALCVPFEGGSFRK